MLSYFVLSLLLWNSVNSFQFPNYLRSSCACSDPKWCQPIDRNVSKEIVGFTFASNSNFELFDWKKLTTVVVFDNNPQILNKLVCLAHKNNVRVHLILQMKNPVLTNKTARDLYIKQAVEKIKLYNLDGANMDFESYVTRNGVKYNLLTEVMRQLRTTLKALDYRYQLTMDYLYCAFCSSVRTYDIQTIKHFVDYFILMDYDLRATVRNSPLVNSPLPVVIRGLKSFLQAGISPSQLVLAFPWYAYSDKCQSVDARTKKCITNGRIHHTARYGSVMKALRNESVQRYWNSETSTPFYNHNYTGFIYQVNYDDPVSLRLKYKVTEAFKLHGVGIWNIDFLDYSSDVDAINDRQVMWNIIPGNN